MKKFFILNSSFFVNQNGAILTLVLVFGTLFLTLLAGLAGFIGLEHRQGLEKVALSQALETAEAGINYYRWRLAHAPEDYLTVPTIGRDYEDPLKGIIGTYELQITSPEECSSIVTVKAVGWQNDFPNTKRIVGLRYGKPSLAQYSLLTNSNIWFGEEEELKGRFHSNGGIRMDGEQDSLATSSKVTYICGPEHGCPYEEKPGIWGEGEGGEKGLWQFPVSNIDYESITLDLSQMKKIANASGIYLAPSEGLGYHLKFNKNGYFDIYKVKKLKDSVCGYDGSDTITQSCGGKGWIKESNDIDKEDFIESRQLSIGGCDAGNLIFVEDRVWVDGEVNEKTTVAAARFPDTPETNVSIIINGNITYPEPKRALLALIAQKNILVPLYSPDTLEIDAVLISQKGRVFRYHYPKTYSPWHLRESIEVRGSIITNGIWTWSYVDDKGKTISGYEKTEASYDSALIYNPPPYLPTTGDYEYISWEEMD